MIIIKSINVRHEKKRRIGNANERRFKGIVIDVVVVVTEAETSTMYACECERRWRP